MSLRNILRFSSLLVLFGFESFLVNAQIFLQSLLSLLNNLLNVFSGGTKCKSLIFEIDQQSV